MTKVIYSFSCDSEHDADILAWAGKQENLSAALRAAVRASWLQGLTLGDVLNELGEVKRMLRAGVVMHNTDDATEPEAQDPETTAAQAALDSLGL